MKRDSRDVVHFAIANAPGAASAGPLNVGIVYADDSRHATLLPLAMGFAVTALVALIWRALC